MALIHFLRRGRRVLPVVVVVALAACQEHRPSARQIAVQVLQREAWVTDAKACPLDVMPSDLRVDWEADLDCAGKNLAGCFAQCRRHEVAACYWLAQALLKEEEVPASNVLFQRTCLLGEASGCTNRAASLMQASSDDSEALSCATRSFQRTCEAGDPWGCTMYGSALHRGAGIARDDRQALEFFEHACALLDTGTHASCEAARKYIQQIRDEPRADNP